jgi:hypothetical protein
MGCFYCTAAKLLGLFSRNESQNENIYTHLTS